MSKQTIPQASITINAPTQKVWDALTDFNRWPEWQKSVSEATFNGSLAIGSVINWKGGGMRIASTLTDLEAPQRIVWEGKAFGMRAVHSWTLEKIDEGTIVSSEDALSGWLVVLITFFKPDFFQKTLEATLAELKAEAEKSI
jgi:uncharacterized protein YndB with AHSA1/START domain